MYLRLILFFLILFSFQKSKCQFIGGLKFKIIFENNPKATLFPGIDYFDSSYFNSVFDNNVIESLGSATDKKNKVTVYIGSRIKQFKKQLVISTFYRPYSKDFKVIDSLTSYKENLLIVDAVFWDSCTENRLSIFPIIVSFNNIEKPFFHIIIMDWKKYQRLFLNIDDFYLCKAARKSLKQIAIYSDGSNRDW